MSGRTSRVAAAAVCLPMLRRLSCVQRPEDAGQPPRRRRACGQGPPGPEWAQPPNLAASGRPPGRCPTSSTSPRSPLPESRAARAARRGAPRPPGLQSGGGVACASWGVTDLGPAAFLYARSLPRLEPRPIPPGRGFVLWWSGRRTRGCLADFIATRADEKEGVSASRAKLCPCRMTSRGARQQIFWVFGAG